MGSLVPTGYKAWRRPTLPQLELKYHRRCLVSRPSSGWDRVGHRRYGHQAMKPAGREDLEIVRTIYWRHLAENPILDRTVDDGGTLKREQSN